jgi:hypothetical protein
MIRERVNMATRPGFVPDIMTDFFASVVWSGKLDLNSPVQQLLGVMEHWDTEFAEKDLSEEDYKERLRSVLTGSYPVAV